MGHEPVTSSIAGECVHHSAIVNLLFRIYFLLMAAKFYFALTHTLDSLRSTLVMLLDLKNTSIAIGLSLLSGLQAEINVISHLLLVSGCHL